MIAILPDGVWGSTLLNPWLATWELGEGWGSFQKLWGPMRGVVGAISPAVRSPLCC